jgi:hypothetical protein
VLKDGNLDKFESRSSDGIFLGYASHSRAYRMLIIDTNLSTTRSARNSTPLKLILTRRQPN